jgi:hypothetical protein
VLLALLAASAAVCACGPSAEQEAWCKENFLAVGLYAADKYGIGSDVKVSGDQLCVEAYDAYAER